MKKIEKLKSKITRITVGRVYNLGNYENCRYEVSADVGDDAPPSRVLQNLVRILQAANPKPPVQTYEVDGARERLKDPQAWHKNVVPEKERRIRIRKMVKESKKTVAKYEAWQKSRAGAMRLLDRIGLNVTHKDAKDDWDDRDEE